MGVQVPPRTRSDFTQHSWGWSWSLTRRFAGTSTFLSWNYSLTSSAILTVGTAAERATIPTPEGIIPITVDEQRRLIDFLVPRPHAPGSCKGPPGDADTKPEPGSATT